MDQASDDYHKNFAMLYAKNCAEIGVIANHTFLELLTQEGAHSNDRGASLLRLDNTSLHDKDILCIAECLRDVRKVRELNLSGNSLTSVGGRHIARALSHNCLIEELDCSNNSLSDDGVVAIASAIAANSENRLSKVNFSQNAINAPGVACIMELFKEHPSSTKLTEITLDNNHLTTDSCKSISSAFMYASSLKKLSLKNNGIGDDAAKILFDGLIHVAETHADFGGLEGLFLDRNKIGDDGLTSLISYRNREDRCNGTIVLNLRALSLRENLLTNDGIKGLANCHLGEGEILSNLESVDIGGNMKLTADSIVHFASILPLSTSLKVLDLSAIKFSGFSMQKLAEGLQANPPLCKLVIAGCVTAATSKELFLMKDALASNTRLEYIVWGTLDERMMPDEIKVARGYIDDIEQTLKLNRRMQSHTASTQKKRIMGVKTYGNDDPAPSTPISEQPSPQQLTSTSSPSSARSPSRLLSTSSPRAVEADQNEVYQLQNGMTGGNNSKAILEDQEKDRSPATPVENLSHFGNTTGELEELRSTLNDLHLQFKEFQSANRKSPQNKQSSSDESRETNIIVSRDDGNVDLKREVLEFVADQLKNDISEEIVDVVRSEYLDEAIESLNQDLEKEAVVRSNGISTLEARLEVLENASKTAAIEREQTGIIIRALATKVDESISLLQKAFGMIRAKNNTSDDHIPATAASKIKNEWKNELLAYEEQQRSERTVIEEHLSRVTHRLTILEETVISEQESSLKALEAILTAAKNRKDQRPGIK